jgi:hypothetical protein
MIELLLVMREDMKAGQEQMMTDRKTYQGMLVKINARMEAWLTDRNDTREETMACQEKTEARLEVEEPTSVDMEPEAA